LQVQRNEEEAAGALEKSSLRKVMKVLIGR
jgi:hypothetical protein